MTALNDPILIIGAGVCGLVLAQALKKHDIPFAIYERDLSPESREQGWGLTIHWAFEELERLLPQDVMALVLASQVDAEVGRNDTGNFLFLNAATGETVCKIPPNKRRLRVHRQRFRRALMTGVEVNWAKTLVSVATTADGVVACFDDGTTSKGWLLVGADGSGSATRRLLAPESHQLYQLPVRFTGAAVLMTADQVAPLRSLDSLLFQATDPTTGNYIWCAMLDTPQAGSSDALYTVQINMSWAVKTAIDEVEKTNAGRLENMRRRADGFCAVLKKAVHDIAENTESESPGSGSPEEINNGIRVVIEVKLADWPCIEWNNQGKMTLIGDAAHAMTMYRGEGANHGILDVAQLLKALQEVAGDSRSLQDALDGFESHMRIRSRDAVLLSRQACLDVHDWERVRSGKSPAVAKRVVALPNQSASS